MTLETALKRVRRRLLLLGGIRHFAIALLGASTLACVWLVLCRLFPMLGDAAPVAAGLGAAALLAAIAWTFYRAPTLQQAALETDRRLGLRERMTTALALNGDHVALSDRQSPMIAAVQDDAQRHLDRLNIRRDFPLVPGPAMRWLAVPLLLFGIGYVLLPELDLLNQRERAIEAKLREKALATQAESLTETAKVLKRPDGPEADPLAKTARELELVAEKLKHGEITQKQGLAKIASLSKSLEQQRKAMEEARTTPKLAGKPESLDALQGLAKALQEGKAGEAAQKMKSLKKKLKKGDLSEQERKKLTKEMEQLKKMLEQNDSAANQALAKALAKASAALAKGDLGEAGKSMENMELSLEDLQSAMEQMENIDKALEELGEWKQAQLGPSEYCRKCGKKLKPCPDGKQCKKPGGHEGHQCAAACSGGKCAGAGNKPGSGMGLGLGGPGQGAGNQVGELPEGNTNLKPTVASGDMTQGKMLANILQKAAPDEDAEAQTQYVEGVVGKAKQEAEQALTKQEIPAAAEEYVRHYFGALESGGDQAANE